MAYSNIKKDKAQIKLKEKLKTGVIGIFLGIVAISAWINIFQQAMILNGAKNRNREAGKMINELSKENQKMEKEIEYATGSAYLQRKAREYLGLGGPNDRWLLVDLESTNTATGREIPESGIKANIMQWWELFAR